MHALEELINKYENLVFSICYRITGNYFESQDITQETFISAYQNFERFDGVNEKAWITKIATNKSIDYLKNSSRKSVATNEDYFIELTAKEPTPEEAYLDGDVMDQLLDHCNRLNPPYDEVGRLYFCEEITVKEMAKILNRSEKTVWTQVYRAKGFLKKIYKKEVT